MNCEDCDKQKAIFRVHVSYHLWDVANGLPSVITERLPEKTCLNDEQNKLRQQIIDCMDTMDENDNSKKYKKIAKESRSDSSYNELSKIYSPCKKFMIQLSENACYTPGVVKKHFEIMEYMAEDAWS
jgi:regulator of replication initiation timing